MTWLASCAGCVVMGSGIQRARIGVSPLLLGTLEYHMQRVVFEGVMADAEMVDAALDIDLYQSHADAVAGGGVGQVARAGRRAAGAA